MRLGDGLADGKAQTRAARAAIPRGVGAVKAVEKMGQMFGGDTGPVSEMRMMAWPFPRAVLRWTSPSRALRILPCLYNKLLSPN